MPKRKFDAKHWMTVEAYKDFVPDAKHVVDVCTKIDEMWWNIWTSNANANWKAHAEKGRWISDLYGSVKADGQTAVIIGAGPSVERDAQYLKMLQEFGNVMFIACDRVVKRLRDIGITPHLIVTTDAQEIVLDMFDGYEFSPETSVSPNLTTHPKVIEYFASKGVDIYWHGIANPCSPFWQLAQQHFGWRIVTSRPIYLVISIAIDIAYWLGFSNIITIGNDLCYYADKAKAISDCPDKNLDHLVELDNGWWTIKAFQQAATALGIYPAMHEDCNFIDVSGGLGKSFWKDLRFSKIGEPETAGAGNLSAPVFQGAAREGMINDVVGVYCTGQAAATGN